MFAENIEWPFSILSVKIIGILKLDSSFSIPLDKFFASYKWDKTTGNKTEESTDEIYKKPLRSFPFTVRLSQCRFYSRSDEHACVHALPFVEDFAKAHFSAVFAAPNGTLSTFSSLPSPSPPPSLRPQEGKSFAVNFSSNVTRARSKLAPHHVGVKGSMKSPLDSLRDG